MCVLVFPVVPAKADRAPIVYQVRSLRAVVLNEFFGSEDSQLLGEKRW
jgi:hypothetical protein